MTALYRPVGLYELAAIVRAGYRAFPPRLPEQPIFYPVLNQEYATEIAERWNLGDPNSGFSGFVTRFDLPASYVATFDIHTVGAGHHQELWIPAKNLSDLNKQIGGTIAVITGFVGPRFIELCPELDLEPGQLSGPGDHGQLGRLLEHLETVKPPGGPQTMGS